MLSGLPANGPRSSALEIRFPALARDVRRAPERTMIMRVWAGLLVGLVASGVAGIVNQVVWQRALKIFLGGSETLSAMIVVLVFLLGLGLGALGASRLAPQMRDPLRALALVELLLALGNTGVALVLGLDITETVYATQRLAVSAHVPLRAVYAVGSALLLLPPTLLMGATLPLASEGLQRQLHATSARLVPVLFFVNTVGASVGAWTASALLLPALGQRLSLLVAVGCNALAAVLIGVLGRAPAAAPAERHAQGLARGGLTREEVLGGVLGLLALGYEMALFRVLALSHHPVPTTFATGLAGYLLFWSVGVALAGRLEGKHAVTSLAVSTAALVAAVPWLYEQEVYGRALKLPIAIALYASPCVGFGALYGLLIARSARDWGRDVGRYAAVNTLGSCAGILLFTLVGYEIPQQLGLWALALGLCAVGLFELGGAARAAAGLASGAALVLVVMGWRVPFTERDGARTYWGRDGVVEVTSDLHVYIDGLWHTKLSDGADHIGSPYSWLMAFGAALAHDDPTPARALVIGGGVGISSGTLAGVEGMQIDVYEINHTLQRVLHDHPAESLHATELPLVDWRWLDARTGMALDETRYDIILSAPLYLRQAGSSLLLSREYLRLVKSRLAPGGVLAVYSNEGAPAQTRLVQSTLAELFAYRVTWYDGLVTIVSDEPIGDMKERLAERLHRPDRLYREAALLDRTLQDEGGLQSWFDGEVYSRELADRVVTDDQPLIEYPELAERWVGIVTP
jgi:spermidine synthase